MIFDVATKKGLNYLSGAFLGLLMLVLCSVLLGEPAYANSKASFALSQPVYKRLEAIRNLLDKGTYQQAQIKLKKMINSERLSSYEKAQVWNLHAYTYYLQENFTDAIHSYLELLREKQVPEALAISTRKTLAQLYYNTEDYHEAIQQLAQIPSLDSDLQFLKAYCYYQLKLYNNAAHELQPLATSAAKAPNRVPQEPWLNLLQASYHALNDYSKMAETLELLASYYPTADHLMTLASVYSQLDAPLKQLSLLETLWEDGQLNKAPHIKNLIALHLRAGAPAKAAKVMSSALQKSLIKPNEKHQKQLIQAWIAAREEQRAINALEEIMAGHIKTQPSESLCLMLGQLYIKKQRWQDGIDRLTQCRKIASGKREKINLLVGIAYAHLQNYDQAKSFLNKAADVSSTERQASQWLAHIGREKQRQKQLESLAM